MDFDSNVLKWKLIDSLLGKKTDSHVFNILTELFKNKNNINVKEILCAKLYNENREDIEFLLPQIW